MKTEKGKKVCVENGKVKRMLIHAVGLLVMFNYKMYLQFAIHLSAK